MAALGLRHLFCQSASIKISAFCYRNNWSYRIWSQTGVLLQILKLRQLRFKEKCITCFVYSFVAAHYLAFALLDMRAVCKSFAIWRRRTAKIVVISNEEEENA
jgi:hypothetical protein